MPVDAAGLTQEDVATMSLHEEFDAYRQRYHHMQELLAGAQRAVNDGPWEWTGSDRGTEVGGDGVAPLAGSDAVNSYFLRTDRIWAPPGATGDPRDLQPMVDYFDEQGWRHREGHPAGTHDTWANTDDGWQIEYVVQPNGRYSLTVYSELFWPTTATHSRRQWAAATTASTRRSPCPASTRCSRPGTTRSSAPRRSDAAALRDLP